eukprot:COSAG06_NODE_209_length_20178_cov_4.309478_11_plen_134_part_00
MHSMCGPRSLCPSDLMLRIWIGFWKLLRSLLVGAMPRFQFCDTEIWMHPPRQRLISTELRLSSAVPRMALLRPSGQKKHSHPTPGFQVLEFYSTLGGIPEWSAKSFRPNLYICSAEASLRKLCRIIATVRKYS